MKVSTTARVAFRVSLSNAGIALELSDAEVDEMIRNIRGALNAGTPAGLGSEVELCVQALRPLKLLLLERSEVSSWDVDQWTYLIWDLLVSATSGTKAALKFKALTESEDAWHDMVTLLLTSVERDASSKGPFWATRRAVCAWLFLLGCMLGYATGFELAGRTKFWLVCSSTALFVAAEVWRRCGFDLLSVSRSDFFGPQPSVSYANFNKAEDQVSVGSASSQIRQENKDLKDKLKFLEATMSGNVAPPLPPPAGAPPLPGGVKPSGIADGQCSPLMSALKDLAAGSSDGPMFTSAHTASSAVQASPPVVQPKVVFAPTLGSAFKLINIQDVSLTGAVGVVSSSSLDKSGCFSGRLRDGRDLSGLSNHFVTWLSIEETAVVPELQELMYQVIVDSDGPQPPTAAEATQIYAPLSGAAKDKVKKEAKIVKELLAKWHSRASVMSTWAKCFWIEVAKVNVSAPQLKIILQSHGYVGASTCSPPRHEELRKQLVELESAGQSGQSMSSVLLDDIEEWALDEDMNCWGDCISPTLERAAPEIFRDIMNSSCKSIRDFINSYFPMDKREGSDIYLELFKHAATVDFLVAKNRHSSLALMKALAEDDASEIGLRRISAYFFKKRTGDDRAANSMLAVKPPGAFDDVAPAWMVSQAQVYSQSEHKTAERVKSFKSSGHPKGAAPKGKEKGKGRGKGKKGKDQHPPPPGGGAGATQG